MEEFNQNQNYEMIKERMKERPINRKKLMRRTIITVSMAVIFGVCACITFLVLEPVFTNLLYPEPEPEEIVLPEEMEEILPEDMLITEKAPEPEIQIQVQEYELDLVENYKGSYQKLYELVKEFRKSMVMVTEVSQDVDWFNNEYENTGQHSGIIFASSTKQFFILIDSLEIENAEEIIVTFSNGSTAAGTYVQKDMNLGLSVITVNLSDLSEETMDMIRVAQLASSKPSGLLASPVIIVGKPFGNTESVAYGMITSKGTTLNLTDCNYELLTTDIYGSAEATGFMINLAGEVLGVVNQEHNLESAQNLISVIGMTELRRTLERMSNGQEAAFLGINGIDVTQEANTSLGVPLGAYVTGIVMDSPAMKAGIQSGDIIVSINEKPIQSYLDFVELLSGCKPEEIISVVISRQGNGEYREITIPITLEHMN